MIYPPIKYLNKAKLWDDIANSVLNFILEEEVLPFDYEYMHHNENIRNEDDESEKQYLEVMGSYDALDLLKDKWNENDYMDSPEYIAAMEEHLKMFPPDEYTKLASIEPFETYEDRYYRENSSKSKLLNSIVQYVLFDRKHVGLDGPFGLEEFTNNHALTIRMGDKSITFPSKESEALVEQVLVQDVIDSLKIFKKNYKESKYHKK